MDPYAGMTPEEIRRERERKKILSLKSNSRPGASMEIASGEDLFDTPVTFKKKKRKKKKAFRP